ncbi:hypothetical protein [Paenibacillus sp. YAF4_2]|uniref:hypothetical protein n=1 Tax=Paenibacillus sp. YAF4_2 TaxID=3233085 RepID=UPI003F9C7287
MNEFTPYLSEKVVVEISGNRPKHGKLIEAGTDLLVLLHQQRYYYIPITHLHSLKADLRAGSDDDKDINLTPFIKQEEQISLEKILQNAKGLFVEISVCGNKPIHGYLNEVMTDYLILHSPIYNTIYIALDHLKWLIPYPSSYAPFALTAESVMVNVRTNTFAELFQAEKGNKVAIDWSSPSERLGVIKCMSNNIVELIEIDGSSALLHLAHIHTLYVPR